MYDSTLRQKKNHISGYLFASKLVLFKKICYTCIWAWNILRCSDYCLGCFEQWAEHRTKSFHIQCMATSHHFGVFWVLRPPACSVCLLITDEPHLSGACVCATELLQYSQSGARPQSRQSRRRFLFLNINSHFRIVVKLFEYIFQYRIFVP